MVDRLLTIPAAASYLVPPFGSIADVPGRRKPGGISGDTRRTNAAGRLIDNEPSCSSNVHLAVVPSA